MIALLILVEGDVVLRSRHVLRVSLRFPPLQGPIAVLAPWLGWTLLLFQHLGECRDYVALHEEESCDLPELVVLPVSVASTWLVALTLLSGVG